MQSFRVWELRPLGSESGCELLADAVGVASHIDARSLQLSSDWIGQGSASAYVRCSRTYKDRATFAAVAGSESGGDCGI